jgi:hypothetical protein
MLNRIRLLSLLLPLLGLPAVLRSNDLDGSPVPVGNAEAARLYRESDNFVSNMAEGDYSYSYLQFYWKRAQSNIDRIRLVYPDSPTSQALKRGELKVGPYELGYFKDRVLYNLEVKRVAAFDDVNCSIFLYGRDENRNDAVRNEALSRILEVMSRRQRWPEAMRFPVLAAHRPLLLGTIFRIAAFYDQAAMVKRLSTDILPSDREAAGFDAISAESQAVLGKPRADLYRFVETHRGAGVREAALKGIVEREVLIRSSELRHMPPSTSIQTTHLYVPNLTLRDNVPEVAARLFIGNAPGAEPLLAVYRAGMGSLPDPDAPVEAHLAYLQFLADSRRFDDLQAYAEGSSLGSRARRACRLKEIELLAAAGDTGKSARLRDEFGTRGAAEMNEATLAEFRGQMDSIDAQLVVRQETFAHLKISDPCTMAVAIMDWSLTPNRSQRGAAPWDAVVAKFAKGFENLPKPKSAEVGTAASTLKPY